MNKGTKSDEDEWFLITPEQEKSVNRSSSSFFTSSGANSTAGFRSGFVMRLTHTMSASGRMAPVFCQMLHLTERELPKDKCPDGVLIVEFPGLAVGASTDIRNNEVGYVVFARQGAPESLIFKKYIMKVYLPYLQMLRERLSYNHPGMRDADSASRAAPSDHLFVCSWMDGGQAQLENIISDTTQELYSQLDITVNKHNAARSAKEQPCDLAKLFMELRRTMEKLLPSEFSSFSHDIERISHDRALDEASKNSGLNLGHKKDLFIRFLICIPQALTHSLSTKDNVVKGFERSGMIDTKSGGLPDYHAIANTLSRQVRPEDLKLIESTFEDLFRIQIEKGQLSDEDMTARGFTQHENEKTLRTSDYEAFQRAKTLNHHVQVKKRKERQRDHEIIIENELKDQYQRNADCLKTNELCELKITAEMTRLRDAQQGQAVDDAVLFSSAVEHRSCIVKLLKGYCLARTFKDIPKKIPGNTIPSVRAKLVQHTKTLREKPVIVNSSPSPTDDADSAPSNSNSHEDNEISIEEIHTIAPPSIDIIKPSTHLGDLLWRQCICSAIKGTIRNEAETPPSEEQCKDADYVYNLLIDRFEAMFVTRDKETKRFHFAFKWTLQNLPRIVAVLSYVKHITPGIHVLSTNKNTCLLASPGNGNGVFLDARSEQTRVLEGNYLYYDTLSSEWIRSGKVSGMNTDFGTRDSQHEKDSKNPEHSSIRFHKLYPDKKVDTKIQKGKFNHLKQYCGLSFMRDGNTTYELTKVENNKILRWDSVTMDELKKRSQKGSKSINDWQLDMCAYLFEFVSGLCLSELHNVSESLGFESIAHTYDE